MTSGGLHPPAHFGATRDPFASSLRQPGQTQQNFYNPKKSQRIRALTTLLAPISDTKRERALWLGSYLKSMYHRLSQPKLITE